MNNKWTSPNCASEITPKTSYQQYKHDAVAKHPVLILINIKSMTYKLQKRDIINICNEARNPSTSIKIISSALKCCAEY